jgi:protein SCO1/2
MSLVFALLIAAPLSEVDVDEKLGQVVPDLLLTDHRGEALRLSQLGNGPIVLVLAYYRCPMLCSLVQNGVSSLVEKSELRPGRDFSLATVSFDPSESIADASKRRASVTQRDWRFLVGDPPAIEQLLESTGVSVAKDPNTGQWAHAAVFLVLTPERRISRYFYGFDVAPADFELAISEAARGHSGASFTSFILRCFSYDPSQRLHGSFITTAFRAGGVVLFVAVFGSIALLFRRERTRRAS